MTQDVRFSASAGIAIGPILFILAMLAAIGAYMSSGNESYTTASTTDRVGSTIVSQANLIRSAINQCNLKYQTDVQIANGNTSATVYNATDPYPYGSPPGTETLVSALNCDPEDPSGTHNSLWSDKMLPATPTGFYPWYYYNGGNTNGRCFYITPTATSSAIGQGLLNAAVKYNYALNYATNPSAEVFYNTSYNTSTQKFVVLVTPPTSGSIDGHCTP